nr:MAG TPA: hypothetical protein [Siphoviridae sp. ctEci12]
MCMRASECVCVVTDTHSYTCTRGGRGPTPGFPFPLRRVLSLGL